MAEVWRIIGEQLKKKEQEKKMAKIFNVILEMRNGVEPEAWRECSWEEAIKAMCEGKIAKAIFKHRDNTTSSYIYKTNGDGEFRLYDREKGTFKNQYMDADDITMARWFVEYPIFVAFGRGNGKRLTEEMIKKFEEEIMNGRPGKAEAMPKEKPPVGLVPRFIRQEQRLEEVTEAIGRYMEEKKPVPAEWLEEQMTLKAILEKRKPGER